MATINLTSGTNSVWINLRDAVPYGATSTSYNFQFTCESTGEEKSFYPTDLQPTQRISEFTIVVGSPEDLNNSKLDIRNGQWEYNIYLAGTLLKTGKVIVDRDDPEAWTAASRPQQTTIYAKR